MARRIGLTTRVAVPAEYAEQRDCLAQDWADYLRRTCPNMAWLPIPNLGTEVTQFVDWWELDGFVLTGGNDVGTCPRRDATERALLDLALQRDLPVLGVCRGLQMIQTYWGGVLDSCESDRHVNAQHAVQFRNCLAGCPLPVEGTVNSYHRQVIRADKLASGLTPFALADDGTVEGVTIPGRKVVAIMWHPERTARAAPWERDLVCWALHAGGAGCAQ